MKNLILAIFFTIACAFGGESNFKTEIEANTYKIDMFSVASNGDSIRKWDHCHAWACEEAPGYLISTAHAFFGRTRDGEIMTFDIYNTEYEAKSRSGSKLEVRVSYADLNTDICLLQIMKGIHPKGLSLTLNIQEAPSFICEENIGKPKLSKELHFPFKIEKDGWKASKRWTHYATVFKSYDGLSGAPVSQDGKVIFFVAKGNKDFIAGINSYMTRIAIARYWGGQHFNESWKVPPVNPYMDKLKEALESETNKEMDKLYEEWKR